MSDTSSHVSARAGASNPGGNGGNQRSNRPGSQGRNSSDPDYFIWKKAIPEALKDYVFHIKARSDIDTFQRSITAITEFLIVNGGLTFPGTYARLADLTLDHPKKPVWPTIPDPTDATKKVQCKKTLSSF